VCAILLLQYNLERVYTTTAHTTNYYYYYYYNCYYAYNNNNYNYLNVPLILEMRFMLGTRLLGPYETQLLLEV